MKDLIFLCTTLVLLLTTITTLAQDYNNYPLKDYYTPDIKRRSLEFGLHGNFEAEKEDKHLVNIYQSSTFHSHTNTRKSISDLYIHNYLSEKNAKQMDDKIDYQNFNGYLGVGYSERKYITPKMFFLYGIDVSALTSPTKETRAESDEESGYGYIDVIYKDNNYSLEGNLQAGIGIGRIENVTDARQAIYILDELSKEGRLSKQLSNDEIFHFAQLISLVKNKRFLDARLHRKDEISKVDSFLVSGNYLTASDATYFTTLYDMWLYGNLFERKSGKEFFINSRVRHDFSHNVLTRNGVKNDPYISKDYDISITAKFLFEKPVRLSWQHSVEASLNYWYTKGNHERLVHSIPLPVKYSLGYYPNTRTHLQLSIEERLEWYIRNFVSEIAGVQYKAKEKSLSSNSIFSLDAEYYVSPHLLLSAEASAYMAFVKYKYLEVEADDPRSDGMQPGSSSNWHTNIEFKAIYKLF